MTVSRVWPPDWPGTDAPRVLRRLMCDSRPPTDLRHLSAVIAADPYMPGRTRWETRSLCEAIRRLDEEFIGDVGSAVVFVFYYMQGGKRELLYETPNHTER